MARSGRRKAAPDDESSAMLAPPVSAVDPAGVLAQLAPAPPFAFERKRLRIDWRLLHGIDLDRVVRR